MQCLEFQNIINTLRYTKIIQIARPYNWQSGSILVKKLFMVLIVMTVIELHELVLVLSKNMMTWDH